jgi:hypothetical protein
VSSGHPPAMIVKTFPRIQRKSLHDHENQRGGGGAEA